MLLGTKGFAERTGLAVNTIRQYKWLGKLPQPTMVADDGRAYWTADVIDRWNETRRRRGER